jgi:hypothetical protein
VNPILNPGSILRATVRWADVAANGARLVHERGRVGRGRGSPPGRVRLGCVRLRVVQLREPWRRRISWSLQGRLRVLLTPFGEFLDDWSVVLDGGHLGGGGGREQREGSLVGRTWGSNGDENGRRVGFIPSSLSPRTVRDLEITTRGCTENGNFQSSNEFTCRAAFPPAVLLGRIVTLSPLSSAYVQIFCFVRTARPRITATVRRAGRPRRQDDNTGWSDQYLFGPPGPALMNVINSDLRIHYQSPGTTNTGRVSLGSL